MHLYLCENICWNTCMISLLKFSTLKLPFWKYLTRNAYYTSKCTMYWKTARSLSFLFEMWLQQYSNNRSVLVILKIWNSSRHNKSFQYIKYKTQMLPGWLLCHCFDVNYYFLNFLWIQIPIKVKRKWKSKLIDEATDPQRFFFKNLYLQTKLYDDRKILANKYFIITTIFLKFLVVPFGYLVHDVAYLLWVKYRFSSNFPILILEIQGRKKKKGWLVMTKSPVLSFPVIIKYKCISNVKWSAGSFK